jgi:hypothetical protein
VKRLLPVLLAAMTLAGCSSSSHSSAPSPGDAYLIVAIDYHFHNAHPTPPLSRDQGLVIDNQSTNVHNVTIPGTSFSKDVRPLQQIVIPRLGTLFSHPGRYSFICKYHIDRGMKGVIVVR